MPVKAALPGPAPDIRDRDQGKAADETNLVG